MNKNQSQSVYVDDGIYYTNLCSDGSSIPQLVSRCEAHGKHFTPAAKQVFKEAQENDAVITNCLHRRIIIPSAQQLREGGDECTTARVLGWAAECGLMRLSFEAALAFCDKVHPDDIESMGIRWVVVTCHLEGREGAQEVAVFTDGHTIDIIFDHEGAWWPNRFGFAFSCEVIDMEVGDSGLSSRSIESMVAA